MDAPLPRELKTRERGKRKKEKRKNGNKRKREKRVVSAGCVSVTELPIFSFKSHIVFIIFVTNL